MQEHSEAWTRVDAILEHSKNPQTKYFGLQVLEGVVRTRWGALPDAQREGIKSYITNLIIALSTDDKVYRAERTFVNKLNLVRRGWGGAGRLRGGGGGGLTVLCGGSLDLAQAPWQSCRFCWSSSSAAVLHARGCQYVH